MRIAQLRGLPMLFPATAALLMVLAAAPAVAGGALPNGGQFVAGQGSITGSANALTINQAGGRAIIDWKAFSIAAANSVFFNNGGGATLNRVTGASPSQIDGLLSATGSVFVINPNGVVIGAGGKVVTGGSFIASTRDLADDAFAAGGTYHFLGASDGDVTNRGAIAAGNGDVVLIGRSVTNRGAIAAPNGTVALAAGDDVVLRPADGDQRIAIASGRGSVTNSGTVAAAAAELKAADGNVYALAGNNGGIVRATGTETVGGHVWLTADGGDVTVTGAVAATNADGSGGVVTARAADIDMAGQVDASAAGAGQDGGKVSIVASNAARIRGSIKAAGAAGGTIETSGHILSVGGATVDAGNGGQWLLDPYDLTVDAPAAATINSSLGAGTNVTLQTTASGTAGPGTPNASGNGDIFIDSPIAWSTAAAFTLSAYRNIDINAAITASGAGALSLTTGTGTAGDYLVAAPISFTGGSSSGASLSINGASYTLVYTMAGLQAINASSTSLQGNYALATSLDATATTNWTPIGFPGSGSSYPKFSGNFAGLDHTISNLTMPSIGNGLQGGVAGIFGNSSGTLRDVGVMNMTVTSGGDGGWAGTLAAYNSGTIRNAYGTGAVTLRTYRAGPSSYAGGLVGQNTGTITNSYASVATTSDGATGGLAGANSGTITMSYATGQVGGDQLGHFGGLVGGNSGSVSYSYSFGPVINTVPASPSTGGLIGSNSGTVTNSYWDTTSSGQSTSAGGVGLTTSQMGSASNFSGWTFGTTPGANGWVIVDRDGGFNNFGGSGGGTRPMLLSEYSAAIANAHQLQLIGLNLAASYTLAGDVDAGGTAGGDVWVGGGFIPIATNGISAPFTGILDGNHHTIDALYINDQTNEYTGLIGTSGGTIRNIGLVGAWVSGGGSPTLFGNAAGGLVANNSGTIDNSFVTGFVSAFTAGGLVDNNTGTITNSYAIAAVVGHEAIPSMTGYSGGLVASNSGTISDSYSAGRIVNANLPSTGNYNGGLVGANYPGGVVSNSYWDLQTSGQTFSDGGTGLTTAQLRGTLPAGFDPGVWSTGSGLYPYLSWQSPGGTPQAMTGTVSFSGSPGALFALNGGMSMGNVAVGADNTYYLLMPGGAGTRNVLLYLNDTGNEHGNTYVKLGASGNAAGGDVTANTLRISSNDSSTNAMFAGVSAAIGRNAGSQFLYSSRGVASATSVDIETGNAGGLDINTALSLSGAFVVHSAGTITVDNTITSTACCVELTAPSGDIVLDGEVDNSGHTIDLNAGGSITQIVRGWLVGAALTGSSGQSTLLDGSGGNQIASISGFNAGSSFHLIDAVGLTISGALTASDCCIELNVPGGIGAGSLTINAPIIDVGHSIGLTVEDGITQGSAGLLMAYGLSGSSGLGTSLTANNQLSAVFGFTSGGGFSLTNANPLTISGAISATGCCVALETTGDGNYLAVDAAITNANHTISLVSSDAIYQNSAGVLTGYALTGSSAAHAGLNGAANAISILNGFTAAAGFSFTDDQTLTINGALDAAGCCAELQTTSGDLHINAPITNSGHTLSLVSAGNIDQSANGLLTSYALTGSSVGSTILNDPNQIDVILDFSAGGGYSITTANGGTVTGHSAAGVPDPDLKKLWEL